MLGDDLIELLGERIPADHDRQVLAEDVLIARYPPLVREGRGERVLDLGCGAGDSVEQFRTLNPDVRWLGVDLERSPEVDLRTRTDAEFRTFDGRSIPADDASVDVVYCKQVLEHVEDPAPLLAETARVLRPGGLLLGSTSQLEPYHSLSVGNITPYGLHRLLERAGLSLDEVRPGMDGLTLVLHRALGMPRVTRRYWSRESPLNRTIGVAARARRLSTRQSNAIKLLLCGQFAFVAGR
ncbi:MAG: methyltransferase domain-containing protein [Actinomycetota bacterium]|nr:methyltransferase domain-containing protein [Actinomycetota bacterium]